MPFVGPHTSEIEWLREDAIGDIAARVAELAAPGRRWYRARSAISSAAPA
jgi:hypothetical protein